MRPLISIIVPVYNNKAYFQDCMNSIKNQTYDNIECIVIDDGSGKEYADYYDTFANEKIRIYHKVQGGVSSARNYGLNQAGGQYVCFVDSDDLILPEYCEMLLSAIETDHVRVAACGYIRFRKKYRSEPQKNCETKIVKGKEIWRNITDPNWSAEGFSWNKMYEKEVIKDLSYDENLVMCEDQLFVFEALSKVESISVIKEQLYLYRSNLAGTTRHLTDKKCLQALYVAEKLLEIVGEDDPEILKRYRSNYASWCYTYCLLLNQLRMTGWEHRLETYREKYLAYEKVYSTKDEQKFVYEFKKWKREQFVLRNIKSVIKGIVS